MDLPRRFRLIRDTDLTGISGVGCIALGVEWPDKRVTLCWTAPSIPRVTHQTISIYTNIDHVINIHCHQTMSHIEWIDQVQ